MTAPTTLALYNEPRLSGSSSTRARSPMPGEYEWVYLWKRPLRVMHWLAALSLVVLAVTGLLHRTAVFRPQR